MWGLARLNAKLPFSSAVIHEEGVSHSSSKSKSNHVFSASKTAADILLQKDARQGDRGWARQPCRCRRGRTVRVQPTRMTPSNTATPEVLLRSERRNGKGLSPCTMAAPTAQVRTSDDHIGGTSNRHAVDA